MNPGMNRTIALVCPRMNEMGSTVWGSYVKRPSAASPVHSTVRGAPRLIAYGSSCVINHGSWFIHRPQDCVETPHIISTLLWMEKGNKKTIAELILKGPGSKWQTRTGWSHPMASRRNVNARDSRHDIPALSKRIISSQHLQHLLYSLS